MPMPADRDLEFVRRHAALAPVPLAPELHAYQATELTPLWRATAADLRGWDDSPFWAFLWPGGQALARYLLDHPDVVRGRTVVDFGAGSGVAGVGAARAGAARVVAYDLDPFCEAAVALNAEANGVAIEFRAGSPLGDPAADAELVLAGDVFYERDLADGFLRWARGLAARGRRVLAGDPGRLYSPREGLSELAAYDVPTLLEVEDRVCMRTRVLEVRS
ncbi:MAG TPA: 50S ribosomal protein L11 methyltransferase [Anaeromyxobacteraceae bacterium]|nr:50S ribosomal protein L11 methyltransferase [Anaeromyxobacteraceae bacterium]